MVLNNQNKPEKEKEKKWSLVPEEVICPFCKKQIKTNVKEEFNWGTCMLYIAMIPLFLFFAWLGCADVHVVNQMSLVVNVVMMVLIFAQIVKKKLEFINLQIVNFKYYDIIFY